jgi:hypothetical protein
MAYASEATARTEQFWCSVKHTQRVPSSHHLSEKYFDYGDAEAWSDDLKGVRWNLTVPSALVLKVADIQIRIANHLTPYENQTDRSLSQL